MGEVKVVQKQGLINEEGKVIVPIEYEEVGVLESGVYVAIKSDIAVEEEKPRKNQYYHHKKIIPVKDESKYHLYTNKGRIVYNEPILDLELNEERIFAVQTPKGWRMVEIDIEKNILCSYYDYVEEILGISDEYIAVRDKNKRGIVYSLDTWEKIIDEEDVFDIIIEERGFTVYSDKFEKYAFYDFCGVMILDFDWNSMEFKEDYITVKEYDEKDNSLKRIGKYSYDGVELEMTVY